MIPPPLPTVDADALTPPAPVISEATTSCLTFRIGQSWYAVPVGEVTEVVSTPAVTVVPGAPEVITGLVQLFGRIVVVLNGAALLKAGAGRRADPEDERGPRCVVLRAGETPFALSVDEVAGVVELAASALAAASSGGDHPGGVQLGDRILAPLQPGLLLDTAESQIRGFAGWK